VEAVASIFRVEHESSALNMVFRVEHESSALNMVVVEFAIMWIPVYEEHIMLQKTILLI
jgi:hypothetical protein